MIKEAENIILSKKYFELSPDELELVNEYVSNEEDFEEMKWFLLSTQASFANEQVKPSTDLKKNVYEHLHQDAGQKRIWLNSLGVFLFPTQKKIYQYPALQMAAIAVIAFGVTFMIPDKLQDSEVAMNLDNQLVQDDDKELISEGTISYDSVSVSEEVDTRLLKDEDIDGGELVEEESVMLIEKEEEMDDLEVTTGLGATTTTLYDYSPSEEPLLVYDVEESDDEYDLDQSGTLEGNMIVSPEDEKNKEKKDKFFNNKGFKKEANRKKDNNEVNNAPGVSSSDNSNTDTTYKTSMAGGAYEEIGYTDLNDEKEVNEILIPVSLHIEQTKELKSLFFTIK